MVKDMEAATNGIDFATLQEEQVINNDMDAISGQPAYTSGETPQRAETATTMRLFQQSYFNRFSLKIQNIVNSGFQPLVEKFIQLNQQYLTKRKVVRIVGEKGWDYQDIGAEDIPLKLDLEANVGSLEYDKDTKKTRLALFSQTKLSSEPFIHKDELARAILEDDVTDVDKIVGEIPAINPVMDNTGQDNQEAQRIQKDCQANQGYQ